jgi:hypothetical protein
LVSRFSLLQQPSSRGAVEQLGVATIDPTHFDRPAPSLIADLVQVHAVKEGAFAWLTLRGLAASPKKLCGSHVRLDVGETQANVGIGKSWQRDGDELRAARGRGRASFAVARAA